MTPERWSLHPVLEQEIQIFELEMRVWEGIVSLLDSRF
jgi:hypothetical protein